MTRPQEHTLVIVADDMTGAADCAVAFSKQNAQVTLVARLSQVKPDVDVVALDFNTRPLTEAQAIERMQEGAHHFEHFKWLYKKIDSTLRGNWAAETASLVAQKGLALVAPAFPELGRSVVGGKVFVNGKPLSETETWQAEHTDKPADITEQLNTQGLQVMHIPLALVRGDRELLRNQIESAARSGTGAVVFDSESQQDLHAIASVTLSLTIPAFWAGSSGLAKHLAPLMYRAQTTTATNTSELLQQHADRSFVVIIGSLSSVSSTQADVLFKTGEVERITLPSQVLREREAHPDWHQWQQRVRECVANQRDLILKIGRDDLYDPHEGTYFSHSIALLVKPVIHHIGTLLLTGGETARAVLVANDIDRMHLISELDAGITLARATAPAAPLIITKAGAFGIPTTLIEIRQLLNASRAALVE
ncbi:four-carbon acid sugar kinase family protein [Carnimonas bestiolae]|uniref:four-carbon acid sugar kinase family protein n=1 Tax=Carnimonas bestiolae TaxID=3402172 RepID=UPI003EDC6E60